jgi:methyltransferase (TIGR00027 family)
MNEQPVVTHISETAIWIAALRAKESKRPDALFRDPLADKLVDERGRKLAAAMSYERRNDWAIVVRTRLIDDLVMTSIEEGADRVINLAAGLDTRPYRLPLPPGLTWIEADLPDLVDEKDRLLAQETPQCKVVREKVDLADAAARAAFLDRALEGAKRALVITEGLLVYLEAPQVEAIARDLAARPAIAWWMIDLASPRILTAMKKLFDGKLGEGATFKFAPAEGTGFFRRLGWRARDVRSYFRWALLLHRLPSWMKVFSIIPDPDPERLGNKPWGAIIRFARS